MNTVTTLTSRSGSSGFRPGVWRDCTTRRGRGFLFNCIERIGLDIRSLARGARARRGIGVLSRDDVVLSRSGAGLLEIEVGDFAKASETQAKESQPGICLHES